MLKRVLACTPLVRRPVIGGLVAAIALATVVVAGSASYSASYTPRVMVVQRGDTLWGIATANHITVAQLAAANHMSANDLLLIGRRLVIPASSAPPVHTASVVWKDSAAGPAPFCAATAFAQGPRGVLPAALAANPSLLALRPVMQRWAAAYGVSPALVEAIAWQESGWHESAVSASDAVGVGQLLPSTADFVNQNLLGTDLSLNSTSDNIRMSAAFLAYLAHQFGNDTCMVAAAYYEGPGAVRAYGVYPGAEFYVRDVIDLMPRFE